MYAPTAAGVMADLPVRASEKITNSSPTVATASESRCGPVARWWVEIEITSSENMVLAKAAPAMQPSTWAGR